MNWAIHRIKIRRMFRHATTINFEVIPTKETSPGEEKFVVIASEGEQGLMQIHHFLERRYGGSYGIGLLPSGRSYELLEHEEERYPGPNIVLLDYAERWGT